MLPARTTTAWRVAASLGLPFDVVRGALAAGSFDAPSEAAIAVQAAE